MTNLFDISNKLTSALNDSNDAFIKLCHITTSDIETGKLSLVQVIIELDKFLTSTESNDRLNGVRFLSTILSQLSSEYLSEQETNTIAKFYCDRLKDHHTLIPSIIFGILSIVKMKNLTKDSAFKLFHGITQNVRCQSEERETRENIYLIFKILFDTKSDDLKTFGPDIIYGILSSIDPEADPRNLIILFNFLPNFIKTFKLGHLTEEMFDCLSRYFPVDFNSQSQQNKNQIVTREQLSNGLENCLSAIPEFAEFCLPLIIDKLSSNVKLAKIESLRLLSKSSSVFGAEGLKEHLAELWPLIRAELLPGNDQEIKIAGLFALENITKALAEDKNIFEKFVSLVIIDVKSSLSDIELSLFDPAEKILKTIAKSCEESCTQVLAVFVPMLLAQYTTKTTIVDKAKLIESLNGFINIAATHGLAISSVPTLAWTDIPGLYLNELSSNEVSLKLKAFIGLSYQKLFLNDTQRATLYDKICIEIDAGTSELMIPCQNVLAVFTECYPTEILILIETRLEIDASKCKTNCSTSIIINRINALTSIAAIPSVASTILPKIIDQTATITDDINSTALLCIERLVQLDNYEEFKIHNYLQNNCKIIDRLIKSSADVNHKNIHIISRICCLIMRKLDIDEQKNVINQHYNSQVLQLSKQIVLLEGLITPLHSSVLFLHDVDSLLDNLLNICLENQEEQSTLSSCKLVAVLINKMEENIKFGKHLNIFHEKIVDILETTHDGEDDEMKGKSNVCEIKKLAVVLLAWITKGLIIKGSSRAQDFLDMYFNTLKMEDIGEYAGEKINILIDKNETTLSIDNHCNVKIFYKQRIFQNFLQQYQKFEEKNSRQNYLIALVHLIEEIPMELLLMHLSKIVPLLIKVLSLDNDNVILLVLKIFKPMIDTKHEIFAQQIDAFIPACLNLVKNKKMHIRIAALNCINSYCNYPNDIIKIYKENVLDNLSLSLDDPKRLVRQIATKTITRWYLINAPGGKE
ncbi:hypothetical protein HCN44_002923 [Aphidius gifuensis]|uniref:MMS19 nucleotide excision repair protein n=1 Tax=Aphidius gifuensis TaxID=684658 RepID=A0A834XRB4_APHGI|nr:MMS19 nucleotide excision repair protein homolog [Aphidius gifuensis]KAF7991361.1 hypothetical protein HCN44_002923 [Aphidius gifuensis]